LGERYCADATAYPAGGGLAMFLIEERFEAFSNLEVGISIKDLRLLGPVGAAFELDVPVFVPPVFCFTAAEV